MNTLLNIAVYARHPILVVMFWFRMGHLPNIAFPKELAEKYLWRKIFDHNPVFVDLTNKLKMKEHFAHLSPDVRSARVIWRGCDVDAAIKAAKSSTGYLKVNNASGANIAISDGAFDEPKMRELLIGWLGKRYHQRNGEWAYKDVVPELFIEEDIREHAPGPVVDFNLYVFENRIPCMHVILDNKGQSMRANLHDGTGKNLHSRTFKAVAVIFPPSRKLVKGSMPLPEDFQFPLNAPELCKIAARIAEGHDHLRVDFMWNGRDLFLCETTVYPLGGYPRFTNPDVVQQMSECWDLKKSWFLRAQHTGWRQFYATWLQRRINLHEHACK